MLIKDLQSGIVREYGTNSHDSLAISQDGKTLSYYNLQCGDGSQYGDFRFVMADGEVPQDSNTNSCCYFNIGGWDNLYEALMPYDVESIEELIKNVKDKTIDEVLRAMYHQCFECDNDEDMQKWDSGNWFRFKLFENVMNQLRGEENEK